MFDQLLSGLGNALGGTASEDGLDTKQLLAKLLMGAGGSQGNPLMAGLGGLAALGLNKRQEQLDDALKMGPV